jgi:non-heme Fe2+,alpha-ketoglutarate-dependent halogenase
MTKLLSPEAVAQYKRDGFYFPVRVMSAADARVYRRKLEAHEHALGGPVAGNMRQKVNVLFTWANELVRNPLILDAVEDLIGPNILCWSTTFFIKEANSPSYVSWHQDATYWGLSTSDVITAWVAFADAPVESGAMKFWPGSHLKQVEHRDTFDKDNLLSRGQEMAVNVPDNEGVDVPLKAGEMSLHNVLLAHGSGPNTTNDRRIGLAIRYIPPHVRQVKGGRDSAMLVRGKDTHGHFEREPEPRADMDAAARAAHQEAVGHAVRTLYQGTDKTAFRA